MIIKRTTTIIISVFYIILLLCSSTAKGNKCKKGCDVALASYYVWEGSNLTYISGLFGKDLSQILQYNPNLPNIDSITTGSRVNVPFSCDCFNGDFLGHTFTYTVQPGDRYDTIAAAAFANLTTEDWLGRVNTYPPTRIPAGAHINVTLNCTCGDAHVSKRYGLFATYPLRPGEGLEAVAAAAGVTAGLVEMYNPGVDFGLMSGIVFVPAKDGQGKFPPLRSSTGCCSPLLTSFCLNCCPKISWTWIGISNGAIAGASVAAVAGASVAAIALCFGIRRRKKLPHATLLPLASDHDSRSTSERTSELVTLGSSGSVSTGNITMGKSVEFSYEELAKATDDFSLSNKIGQGGFGSVYYAELRGEKAAIKKMDMQASKEFLAELQVLTRVHHLNLVRLIGYCIEGSLFLVYEYIENGNLSQHLRGEEMEALPWAIRVQIALDSARGLEYIHEHTVPVYIHRDIKSANILIDRNFRGKVADFGLTKLTEYGSTSMLTRLVGTFGYMPPEYAQYGDVSPKVDVYAFGVVLYELISAKEAVVKTNETVAHESKGLVALFEDALRQPDPWEDLSKLVDPKLGKNYPIDSVSKMAELAKACTQESPQLRPSMRSIVVALMTLSTTSEDWDVGSLYENQTLLNLMTGR